MDLSISNRGYGLAPFPHLLSPTSPRLMHFGATRCICVYFETGTLSWKVIHSVCLLRSISFCPLCPRTSFAICYGVEHWGQGAPHTRPTRLRVPVKVVGLLHDGHVELEYDQGGVRVVNHRCPMDSISFGIPNLESPPPSPSIRRKFPQLTSLPKFLWTPLLMEATIAVAPGSIG